MPANVFGVLMSLEPAVAAFAGFIVLGQDLGAREIVAIALVVAASIGVTRGGSRGAAPGSRHRRLDAIPGASRRPMFGLNLPNFLTLLRILLVPVLVAALLAADEGAGDVLAAVVFAVASFTDAIDGWLARRREAVTNFGKLMDPVADKLLIIAALLSLVSLDRLDAWVAMVIIAREFAVTVARLPGPRGGRRDPRQLVGQGQDRRAGPDDLPADPRRPLAGLGRRARLRDGRS